MRPAKGRRFTTLLLTALLVCGSSGRSTVRSETVSVPSPGALEQTQLQTEDGSLSSAGLTDPPQTEFQTEAQKPSYVQLTGEDIVRLDGGDAELLYDDEGRVTFIRGRYSPEKVENSEDAVKSLNYVANLLGLTNGALLFAVYQGIDHTTGYSFYLFLQRDGDVTIANASIKVYVDPDGYTAALSCSFNPAIGVHEETRGSISAREAEKIVCERYPDRPLTVYSDYTSREGIMEDNQVMRVWSVFTNNPDTVSGGSDKPYLQHFVSYSGQYLMNLPSSSTYVPLLERDDDALERRAKAMFEGYEKETWTGKVRIHGGNTIDLTVPVAKSKEDGRYYLMDLDRKILVADYWEAAYGSGKYVLSSSDTNGGWKDRELLAMYNIGRVYDYFADHGYDSVDGIGIPLAILSGVCEPDGSPVDNAYFSGFRDGFGTFAISDINDAVESLDIMGHEFTHGITTYSMGGCAYINDLGAINEAFSDIMGNLCELTYSVNNLSIMAGKTTSQFEVTGTSPYGSLDDPNPVLPDWRIGEMSGKVLRDMSNPVMYRQPAFVRDAYYCLSTDHPNVDNDYGGVHVNSSLLGSIAWVLNRHGLDYEKQYSLWMTAMNMMTPNSDYDDVLQALIFARKTYGWDDEIDTWLAEAFAERGLLEKSHSQSGTWDGVSFTAYNADYLEEEETAAEEDFLGNFLTGGAGNAGESDAQNISDTLGSLLSGGQNAGRVDPDLPGSLPGGGKYQKDWLAGVGLDQEGRITRDGYGRIETGIALQDREKVTAMVIIRPYTYEVLNINCPNEEGRLSLLVQEGKYWVTLAVTDYTGDAYWSYTKNGTYEKLGTYTVFGEVEVRAGQCTMLPFVEIS